MNARTPLPVKGKPLAIGKLIPAWGDEFDLRHYFAAVHPNQYELREPKEYVLAKQVMSAAVANVITWVGLYRASMLGRPEHPDLLAHVVACVRSAQQRDLPGYVAWYDSPQPEFGDRVPQDWFRERDQTDLAELLCFHGPVEESDLIDEMPISPDDGTLSSGPLSTVIFGKSERQLNADERRLSQVIPMFFSEGDWGDEFDLAPYFASWSPVNYCLNDVVDLKLALELYESMTREFRGWMEIYRSSLVVGCKRNGVLEPIARCVMKMVDGGPSAYREWYKSPQPEVFEGRSPEQWFIQNGLPDLSRLLKRSGN